MKFVNKKKYKFLKLFVTERCNLSCPYCCFGNQRGKCKDFYTADFKFESYKKIFKRLNEIYKNRFKFVIRIIGGEPLLFKRLNDLIHFLNTLEFIEYIELYSNCTLEIPPAIKENNKNIIVTSIHRLKENKEENVLKNIEASGMAKKTQFNILLKSGVDIKENIELFRNRLTRIYNMGATAFPQLIQEHTEYYLDEQRETMPEILDFFHEYGSSYYEDYCIENLGLTYNDFFNKYCSHKNHGIIKFLSSSYKINENLFLSEDFDGRKLGFLNDDLKILDNIKFDFRKIDISKMFINELLFSCYFEL